MGDPQVSVILPVYNAGKTLSETLDSLLAQRFEAFEIIAIDDGSDDDTPVILNTYANRDPRIRILSPGRQGLIGALNTGIDHAKSDLIARMDADDFAHPERIGLQYNFLQTHLDIALVSCLIRCFPEANVGEGFRIYEAWLNSLTTPEAIAREIFIESPVCHPSIMLRKSCLKTIGGYKDFGWAEDYDLWLRLHMSGMQFAKVPQVLHHWRESPERLTRTDSRYSVENFLRAKAHYLRLGPLSQDPRALIWGAGQMGRRLSKHLVREGIDLIAFVDIDPRKIGNTRRGAPIIAPETLAQTWKSADHPLILAAVPSRGARELIRERLSEMGLTEGENYLCVA